MEVDTHMAGLRFVELPTGVHQKMDDTWGQLNQLNPEKKTFLSYVVTSN